MVKALKIFTLVTFILLIAQVFTINVVFASDGTVTGKVRNAIWGPGYETYISGVSVYLDSKTGTSTTTDSNGQYSLSNVSAGDHILIFEKTGFVEDQKKFTAVDSSTVTCDMSLIQADVISSKTDSQFFSGINLDFSGLSAVKTAVNTGDYRTAKYELREYYRNRTTPVWLFNPDDSGVDPYYSTAIVSDEMLHNFTIFGYKANPDNPAGNIDWQYIPQGQTADWYQGLNRHYQFNHFTNAWKKTVNSDYAYEFMAELIDWVKDNPKPASQQNSSGCWRTIEAGIRQELWGDSLYNILDNEDVTSEAFTTFLKSTMQHGEYLYSFPTSSGNWLIIESYGLYYLSVLHPEFNDASTWKSTAVSRAENELDVQVWDDGWQFELSANYHYVAMMSFVAIEHLAALNGESTGLKSDLKKMFDAGMFVIQPNGYLPMLNDSSTIDFRQMLSTGSNIYKDTSSAYGEDYLWLSSGYKGGTPPSQTSYFADRSGYITMRDYWGENTVMGLFDVGHKGVGNHNNHRDELQLGLWAYGNELLTDPNRDLYGTIIDSYLHISKAHNVIQVDGRSQRLRADGDGSALTGVTWETNKDFDYSKSTFDGKFEDWSTGIDVTHTRSVLFVKPEYFIVSDVLNGSGTHTLEQFWNFAPGPYTWDSTNKRLVTQFPTGGNVMIVPADKDSLTTTTEVGVTGESGLDYGGWTDYSYGHAEPSVNLCYEKSNTSVPNNFDTIIWPFDNNASHSCTVTRLSVSQSGQSKQPYEASGLQINSTVNGVTSTDYYFRNNSLSGTVIYGNFTFDGEVGWIRKSESGVIVMMKKYPETSVIKENGTEIKIPDGDLTSPESGAVINTDTVTLEADAVPYSGQTIYKVGFYAVYTDSQGQRQYPFLGYDYSPPYSINWDISGISDQEGVQIFARVWDTSGNLACDVGGIHRDIVFDRSSKVLCTIEGEANNVTASGTVKKLGEPGVSNGAAIQLSSANASVKRKVDFTATGYYNVRIRARKEGNNPTMRLKIDGSTVQDFTVDNTDDYIDYIVNDYNVTSTVKKDIEVIATNGSESSKLVVDCIYVSLKKQCEDFTTRSSTHAVTVNMDGQEGWRTIAFWSENGWIEDSFNFPETKNYVFRVRAQEQHSQSWEAPNFPRLVITVDGETVVDRYIMGEEFKWYEFPTCVPISAGNHTIRLRYYNDHWDPVKSRYLYVDAFEIDEEPNDYAYRQQVAISKGMATTGDLWTNYTVTAKINLHNILTDQSGDKGGGLVARNSSGKGYSLYYNWDNKKLEIKEYDNSETWTTLTNVSYNADLGKWYRLKFEVNGTDIRGKIWEDGASEPGSWTVSTTDSTCGSGNIGLLADRADVLVDDVKVYINGDEATTVMPVLMSFEDSNSIPGAHISVFKYENGAFWRVDNID